MSSGAQYRCWCRYLQQFLSAFQVLIKGAVKKLNTQARATILRKLGLADTTKKKNEPKKAYDKQAGREMPCTKCNKVLNQAADLKAIRV